VAVRVAKNVHSTVSGTVLSSIANNCCVAEPSLCGLGWGTGVQMGSRLNNAALCQTPCPTA
jgi:hypothetical protein